MAYSLTKRILFFSVVLISIMIGKQSFAQSGSISGKVIDATSMEALPFAHVFINQTTIGTTTDSEGRYKLENIPVGEHLIVYSFVGYTSHQAKVHVKENESRQMDIRLYSDNKLLKNVEVNGTRDKAWEKQEKKFEKIFLGTTRFAQLSKIVNPWVVDFQEIESNGKEVFMASSTLPIEIENRALGYRMFYYLESMVSNASGFSIKGQVRFELMKRDDEKEANKWKQNRLTVYKGSLRHLIASIIDNRVIEEGFDLYTHIGPSDNNWGRARIFSEQLNKSIKPYSYQQSVQLSKEGGEFIISVKEQLEIHYRSKYSSVKIYNDVAYPISWLDVKEGYLRANSNGIIHDPPFAIVSGAMYEDRVAHLLPYDYLPD